MEEHLSIAYFVREECENIVSIYGDISPCLYDEYIPTWMQMNRLKIYDLYGKMYDKLLDSETNMQTDRDAILNKMCKSVQLYKCFRIFGFLYWTNWSIQGSNNFFLQCCTTTVQVCKNISAGNNDDHDDDDESVGHLTDLLQTNDHQNVNKKCYHRWKTSRILKELNSYKQTIHQHNCSSITNKRANIVFSENKTIKALQPIKRDSIDVNYVLSVATLQSILYFGMNLTVQNLHNFLTDIFNNEEGFFGTELDSRLDIDLIQVLLHLTEKDRANMNVKLLDMGVAGCTCLAKCFGPGSVEYQAIKEDYFKTHTMMSRCAHCLLSPNAQNTTAKKPRATTTVENSELTLCSMCNLDTYRHVQLYRAHISDSSYFFRTTFYTTNSVNHCATLTKTSCAGPTNHYYGLCTGHRQCYKMVHGTSKSLRTKNEVEEIDYCDPKIYKCRSCSQCESFDAFSNTCVDLAYSTFYKQKHQLNKAVMESCIGCCLYLLCQHRDKEILSYADGGNLTIFLRRSVFLNRARKIICSKYATTRANPV